MHKPRTRQEKDFYPIGLGICVFLFSTFCYPLYFVIIGQLPDAVVNYIRGPSLPGGFSLRGAILIEYGPSVLMLIVAGMFYLVARLWYPRFRRGLKYGILGLLVVTAIEVISGLYYYL
jgi:hypothetical protein